MSLEITVRSGTLEVVCSGPYSQPDVLACIDKIDESKREHPAIERCLLDCRNAKFEIDLVGRFRIGEYAARKLAGRRLRIAMVASKEAITRMVENTACNRGLPMFTTHDIAAAEVWLAGDRSVAR